MKIERQRSRLSNLDNQTLALSLPIQFRFARYTLKTNNFVSLLTVRLISHSHLLNQGKEQRSEIFVSH